MEFVYFEKSGKLVESNCLYMKYSFALHSLQEAAVFSKLAFYSDQITSQSNDQSLLPKSLLINRSEESFFFKKAGSITTSMFQLILRIQMIFFFQCFKKKNPSFKQSGATNTSHTF